MFQAKLFGSYLPPYIQNCIHKNPLVMATKSKGQHKFGDLNYCINKTMLRAPT